MLRRMSQGSQAGTADRIGILGYDSFHFVVESFERSKKFYENVFDFKEVARAGEELVVRGHARRHPSFIQPATSIAQ